MRPFHENFILAIVVVLAFGILGVCSENVDRGPMDCMGQKVCQVGGPGVHVAEGIKLYIIKPKPHPLAKSYPELFPGTEAVVVTFGSPTCPPCRKQKAMLQGHANKYAIVLADVSTERWRVLFQKWNLGSSIPVTVVVERGEVVKTFVGFTPWEELKPHCKKAVLNEKR